MSGSMLDHQQALLVSSALPSPGLCEPLWPSACGGSNHRDDRYLLLEPRSVLDLRSPSPASSSLSPSSFGASSSETGERGGGRGRVGLEGGINGGVNGKEVGCEAEGPLIDCTSLLDVSEGSIWGEVEGGGGGEDGAGEFGLPWGGGWGEEGEAGVAAAAAGGGAVGTESVVDMFDAAGGGGPTLDEVFGAVPALQGGGAYGGEAMVSSGGGGEEWLPKLGEGGALWNLADVLAGTANSTSTGFSSSSSASASSVAMVAAPGWLEARAGCRGGGGNPTMCGANYAAKLGVPQALCSPPPPLLATHPPQQQQQQQQLLFPPLPLPLPHASASPSPFLPLPSSAPKRPRFSPFPSHPSPLSPSPFLFPDTHSKHPFFLSSSPAPAPAPALVPSPVPSPSPWLPLPLPLPRVLSPPPPIHFLDLDPSRPHPQFVGKSILLEELLHAGKLLAMAAEAAEFGNTPDTQAILARLNLNPSSSSSSSSSTPPPNPSHNPSLKAGGIRQQHGGPMPPHPSLHRAALLFKEAISRQAGLAAPRPCNPGGLDTMARITAYKSFCENSLIPQFGHFTANQATLEAIDGENCIHLIDFELGLGERWASFMQELSQRCNIPPQMKITAVLGSDDGLEIQLAKESLLEFARGLNINLSFDALPIAKLDSLIRPSSAVQHEALMVNFGSCGLSQLLAEFRSTEPLLSFLHFIKSLSPKLITMMDKECDAGGAGTSTIVQALRFYMCLLESLDCTDLGADAVAGIEAHLVAPQVSKAVMMRRLRQSLPSWRSLMQRAGFRALPCSPATEAQAGGLIKPPNTGFTLARQHTSLVLGWHNTNLLSASSWGL